MSINKHKNNFKNKAIIENDNIINISSIDKYNKNRWGRNSYFTSEHFKFNQLFR